MRISCTEPWSVNNMDHMCILGTEPSSVNNMDHMRIILGTEPSLGIMNVSNIYFTTLLNIVQEFAFGEFLGKS